MKKRFIHFIQHQSKKTLTSIGGGLFGAMVLVVGALIFSTFSPNTQLASATLSPQSIGLGKGVAACFSSVPTVTCSGGNNVITVNRNASNCGANPYVRDVLFATVAPSDGSDTGYIAEQIGLSCGGGTEYISFSGNASTKYYLQIQGDQGPTPSINDQIYFYGLNCSNPAPASMSYSCAAGGGSVLFSWPAAPGATDYYPRFSTTGGFCPAGWTKWTDGTTCYINSFAGTSVWAAITPGASYSNAWVHSGEPPSYAVAQTGAFTCVATPTMSTASCSGGTATLNWTPVAGATNYHPIIRYPSPTTCPAGWAPWGSSTTDCKKYPVAGTTDSSASGLPAVGGYEAFVYAYGTAWSAESNHVSFSCAAPPAPSGPVGSCNAAGTSAIFSWVQTPGYTTYYTRASTGGIGVAPFLGAPAWNDTFVGPPYSVTFPTTPGTIYYWWVHTRDPVTQAWSAYVSGTINCTPTSPGCTAGSCTGGTVCSAGSCVASCPNGSYNSSGLCCANGSVYVSGSCVASCTPGNACTSAANSCGMTASGVYSNSCSCSGTVPSNTLCPSVTLLSASSRVRSGQPATLSWSSLNVSSCSLVSNPIGFSSSALTGTNVSTSPLVITGNTTFTLMCTAASGAVSTSVQVGVLPKSIEQ